MTENRISANLQAASHLLVVGAGLVYLFGFIVVSVFDASYGIADFSVFRTKVIAVGALFVFLVGLAMIVTFRIFHIFGLAPERANPSPIQATPQNRAFIIADVALSIPFACVGLTMPLVFLFTKFPWTGSGYIFIVLSIAAAVALGFLGLKWLNTHPFLFVSLSALNTAGLLWILFRYADRSNFWFVVWLSVACTFTFHISQKLRKTEEIHRTEWERLLLIIVPAIFGLYATRVFPNIKHEFGGGAPVPVILHLTKKLPPFDSEIVPVSLIDETEQGYYVLRGSDKAVFVARGMVEAVEFLRSGQTAQSAPVKP
jgi:hypothetical protein